MRLPRVLIVALRQYPLTRQAFRHELKTTMGFKSFEFVLDKKNRSFSDQTRNHGSVSTSHAILVRHMGHFSGNCYNGCLSAMRILQLLQLYACFKRILSSL